MFAHAVIDPTLLHDMHGRMTAETNAFRAASNTAPLCTDELNPVCHKTYH